MKNLSKDKRKGVILVAVIAVAAAVGVWQLMIVTQQNGLATVAKRIAEQTAKLDQAQRLVSSTVSLSQELELTTKKLQLAESEMASGDTYSWVIETVGRFRESYEVDIPQFSREVPCSVGMFANFPYKAVLFNVRGTAHFHELGRFLADFENRFSTLRVQNLELESAGTSAASQNSSDPEKLSFRMEIVALVNPNTL